MGEICKKIFNRTVAALLVFQLAGCGTLLYPERKGQVGGRLDVGVTVLDAIGLLFFLIPGIIAFAVDFSNGCIYLPRYRPPLPPGEQAGLMEIRFDPKRTTIAQIEKIIKDQTGYEVQLTQADVRVTRLASKKEMIDDFARSEAQAQPERLAFNH